MANNLLTIFRLLELTRSQPQYGYVLAGIQKSELSDLAQHHYLVSFIGWRLAKLVQTKGGDVNPLRVLEICLVHDLGELFGGDIAMPYAQANPAARQAATAFETENHRYLAKFLEMESGLLESLFEQARTPQSDEGIIAKIADYVEVTHYKLYVKHLTPNDVGMVMKRLQIYVKSLSSPKNQAILSAFLHEWSKELCQPVNELFEGSK